ncbi:MAG: dihydrolipoyl dehydrogenase [Myxococcota bacterium]
MEKHDVDVAVLGAGTAGLVARRSAEKAGAKAVMIDPGPFGTTCARVGCMPSKLLIAAADAAEAARTTDLFGVRVDGVRVEGPAVMERVQRERDRFVGFVLDSVESIRSKGGLIEGRGRFVEQTVLRVSDEQGEDFAEVHAKSVVIATGSRPSVPPPYRGLGERMLTTNELFELPALPESILVVGPGVIGLELGQALDRLGVRTTMIGVDGLIGPLTDPAVKAEATRLAKEDLDIHLDTKLESVEETEDGVHVAFLDDEGERRTGTFEYVLMAAGRRPNVDGLGLEEVGLPLRDSGIPDYDWHTMQVKGTPVFLAGDNTAHRPILHEASDDGGIAGENAARYPHVRGSMRRAHLAIVFSHPQIAIAGHSHRELTPGSFVCGHVDYGNQGRARVMGENAGLVRVYASKDNGELLGAEMLGPRVEHTGHLLAWAIQQRMTVEEALDMPFYHPVVEEGIRTALRECQSNLHLATPCEDPSGEVGPGG